MPKQDWQSAGDSLATPEQHRHFLMEELDAHHWAELINHVQEKFPARFHFARTASGLQSILHAQFGGISLAQVAILAELDALEASAGEEMEEFYQEVETLDRLQITEEHLPIAPAAVDDIRTASDGDFAGLWAMRFNRYGLGQTTE